MMLKLKKQFGYTMIEFIFVMVLVAIIVPVSVKIFASALNSILVAKNTTNADEEARVAMDYMVRELRNALSPSNISNTSGANSITFTDSSGNTITYSLSGSSLMRNSDVLADGISSLTFTYYDKNGAVITPPPTSATIYIQITLGVAVQTSSFSLTTTAYLRNAT